MVATNSIVTEDYLKALYSAEERGEDGLGVTELARRMGVVASTASETVRKLDRDGLVEHVPYQRVHLTKAGRDVAISIVRRHRILETYLYQRLGFEWDEVHREAEILEHAVSDTLLQRMDHVLGYPLRDPHGDPIPQPDGAVKPPHLIELGEADEGSPLTVGRISDADPALLRHLESLGLVLDASIEVVQRMDFAAMSKVKITPPVDWRPRSPELLVPGVAPGVTTDADLSDLAAGAIWVLG